MWCVCSVDGWRWSTVPPTVPGESDSSADWTVISQSALSAEISCWRGPQTSVPTAVTGHATSGGDKHHVSLDSYKTASVGKKFS